MVCSMSDSDWSARSFLVTGASGWLGEGLALALLGRGASVIAHHRSPLPASLAGHPRITPIEADLTSVTEIRAMAARVADVGPLHGLVNNAAAQPVDSLLQTSEESYDEVLDAGLKSAFFLTQAIAPVLSEGSAIVNIASIEGLSAPPGHAHYGAAKAGLLSLTRTAAVELAPRIRVNAILPGLIHRPGIDEQWPDGVRRWRDRAPLQRLGERADIANAMLFLLSEDSAWITGASLAVDGGILARTTW